MGSQRVTTESLSLCFHLRLRKYWLWFKQKEKSPGPTNGDWYCQEADFLFSWCWPLEESAPLSLPFFYSSSLDQVCSQMTTKWGSGRLGWDPRLDFWQSFSMTPRNRMSCICGLESPFPRRNVDPCCSNSLVSVPCKVPRTEWKLLTKHCVWV